MRRWPRAILTALVLLAVLLSFSAAYRRWQAEAANRTVMVAVDYHQVDLLAGLSGVPQEELLSALARQGVGALLVKEPTIADLAAGLAWGKGGVWIKTGAQILAEDRLPPEVAAAIVPSSTYLLTPDRVLAGEMASQLRPKLPGLAVQTLDAGRLHLVGVPLSSYYLVEEKYGLGFGGFPWAQAAAAGLKVIPQVRPWPAAEAAAVKEVLAALRPHREEIALLLFDGDRVPGYPQALPELAAATRELGVPLGIIEFSDQQGLPSLVRLAGKKAVRVHSIRVEEMNKMSPDRALDRLLLAAAERNVRVLAVRFFRPGQGGATAANLLEYNLSYLERLREGLLAQGLSPGPARPFISFPLPRLYFVLLGLGAWAAAVLLLASAGLGRRPLWGLAALGLVGFLGLAGADLVRARQAAALVTAMVFPVLAILGHRKEAPAGLGQAVVLFLRTSAVSLAGAALVVGLLADVGFMLRLDQFLGTKLAHLAPPVLLFALLWALPRGRKGMARWLASPVTWLSLVILVLAVAAGYVYLVRTGNEGVAFAPAWEKEVRRFLDALLLVRPRTKEFLLGHPALLLAYYLGYRERRLVLWLVAGIGQASLINTFAHTHTPLIVSLLRTLNGLWLGLALGLLVILVYRWAARLAAACRAPEGDRWRP